MLGWVMFCSLVVILATDLAVGLEVSTDMGVFKAPSTAGGLALLIAGACLPVVADLLAIGQGGVGVVGWPSCSSTSLDKVSSLPCGTGSLAGAQAGLLDMLQGPSGGWLPLVALLVADIASQVEAPLEVHGWLLVGSPECIGFEEFVTIFNKDFFVVFSTVCKKFHRECRPLRNKCHRPIWKQLLPY